ncbi:hypothetical protein R83H12_01027 [Fibrobacteria bacterium R8-3-H12]
MINKIAISILLFGLATNAFSQETPADSYFQRNFNNRVHLGYFSSYFDDNIRLLQFGYDAILKMIYINPQYNLFDAGLGLNGLLAYDMVNKIQKDNFGHERPKNGRTTMGFELNWNIRLYFIPIPKINSRIFTEGCGMSLLVYSREFPETGTHINIGTNIGLGMEYPINNYKAYTILKWFHSSNGKEYENNPALNTAGIVMGLQF